MTPADFWAPWEGEPFVDLQSIDTWVRSLGVKFAGRTFAWRGVTNAEWALHSALYRRLLWTTLEAEPTAEPPTESALREAEARVVADARRWGLHSGVRGRLSYLELLATLQHFGAPTRLLDVTFNPYAALFFAVEDQPANAAADGRLFAIDVTDRLINDKAFLSEWEHDAEAPWMRNSGYGPWSRSTVAWRPAAFDRRIAAQHGAFILGGVPDSEAGQWPKAPRADTPRWSIAEVRSAVSVPLRVHKVDGGTRQPDQPVYTVRIAAAAKPTIRDVLERTFALSHASVYPDVAGFVKHGTPQLREAPPTRK